MNKFKLAKYSSIAVLSLISILSILLHWFILPVMPTTAAPSSEIFSQVWETVNQNFYDSKFNGVDWQAMRSKYEPQIKSSKSPEEVAATINQMLAELKTSHTYFYTPDNPAYYQILGIFAPILPDLLQQLQAKFSQGKIEYSGIGIFTKTIEGNTFVSGVLEGSPAAAAGLMVGDRIINVEGRPFQPIESFLGKAGTKVTLLIQRSSNTNSQEKIAVTPKMLDATTMFLDAMVASTQVIEREGKKIGYVHIWSYAGDSYQKQLEEELFYGRLKDTDGLVLDLRDGWGGAPLTALNIYADRSLSLTNVLRDRTRFTVHSQWIKPVVMLVNEGSRSSKEILAYGFQQLKIGLVVGTQTAGAVVAGRLFAMQDGSLLYVAVADVYLNNNRRLEGKGVTPDIVVSRPIEYSQNTDPQKERAIEIALDAVKQRV
jgi:carboxyl-terminal processing protease